MHPIVRSISLFLSLILATTTLAHEQSRQSDDQQDIQHFIASSTDLFTSVDHMQFLIHSHNEITKYMKDVIEYQKKKVELARE